MCVRKIHLYQKKVQWRALVNPVMDVGFLIILGIFVRLFNCWLLKGCRFMGLKLRDEVRRAVLPILPIYVHIMR
jgi:hypothetical protein